MKVGDKVRLHASDCCLEVEAEGVIEAVERDPDSAYTSASPDDPDATIVAVTIGGVKITHPWGNASSWDIEPLP